MINRLGFAGLLLLAAPRLEAQSSQFGTRGFGLPLRPISVRAVGTGGSLSLFDHESALNPSSFGLIARVNTTFQTVQTWTHADNPVGTASTRDNRYPGFTIQSPIGGTPLVMAISATGYMDRNFSLVSRDTIVLRGAEVEVLDTITSLGGISDLRAALAWRQSPNLQLGLGFHLLTGSNRITSHRVFADTAFTGASERATLSYLSYGVSAGLTARPVPAVTFAAMVRADDKMRIERDSVRSGTVKLPLTVAGGLRLQLGRRTLMAASGMFRNWSRSSADLVSLGGHGSRNTTEWNGGFEFTPNPDRTGRFPLRLGVYRATLPFPLADQASQHETGVSAGTSFEFAAGRARGDLALSRLWRTSDAGFSERAVLLNLGVSIRP
jgi:hypothetical protein